MWVFRERTPPLKLGFQKCLIDYYREDSPTCCGCKRRESGHLTLKRGRNTKIHLAVDSFGLPVRFHITDGITSDCTQAIRLIKGIPAQYLLADRCYDSNEIVEHAKQNGMEEVIPPKKNRTEQREYDEYIYKLRPLVENAFLKLKSWRAIATRYAKNTASFLSTVQIACIRWWLKIS